MLRLQGENIYLAALTREDCKKLWEDTEYDFDNPTDTVLFGASAENADKWFDDIQKAANEGVNVRLGIFLNDGTVVGDVALQDIDKLNRSCTLGMGFSKMEYRGKGYGRESARLILKYGFHNMGLWRIWASTLGPNIAAQKSLEGLGFMREGIKRQAVYFCGEYVDELHYGMLRHEFNG